MSKGREFLAGFGLLAVTSGAADAQERPYQLLDGEPPAQSSNTYELLDGPAPSPYLLLDHELPPLPESEQPLTREEAAAIAQEYWDAITTVSPPTTRTDGTLLFWQCEKMIDTLNEQTEPTMRTGAAITAESLAGSVLVLETDTRLIHLYTQNEMGTQTARSGRRGDIMITQEAITSSHFIEQTTGVEQIQAQGISEREALLQAFHTILRQQDIHPFADSTQAQQLQRIETNEIGSTSFVRYDHTHETVQVHVDSIHAQADEHGTWTVYMNVSLVRTLELL